MVFRSHLASNVTQWPFYTSHSQAPTFGIFYGCLQNRQHFIAYVMFDIAGERYLKRLPRKKERSRNGILLWDSLKKRSILWDAIVCVYVLYIYIHQLLWSRFKFFHTSLGWSHAILCCRVLQSYLRRGAQNTSRRLFSL